VNVRTVNKWSALS